MVPVAMTQSLRALAARPEFSCLIPGTHMVAHSHNMELQSQGVHCPLQISIGTRHTCGGQTYT